VLERIDSVIITGSNKEYLWIYKIIKFYIKAFFLWLCFRTSLILLVIACLHINQDLSFNYAMSELLSNANLIDMIFLFALFLILMALLSTFAIKAIAKPRKS